MKRFKEQQEASVPDSQTYETDENLAKCLQAASLTPIVEPETSPQHQVSAASNADEPKPDETSSQLLVASAESKLDVEAASKPYETSSQPLVPSAESKLDVEAASKPYETSSQPLVPSAESTSKLDVEAEACKGVPFPNTEDQQKVPEAEGEEKGGGEVEKVKESPGTQDLSNPVDQSLDSAPKPAEGDEVEIMEPPAPQAHEVVMAVPESSKCLDHSIGLLEDMLKHGLDLTTAIGHLKGGTWPYPKADGSKAPVVSRIKQFKNKSGQTTEEDVRGPDDGSTSSAPLATEPNKGKGKGKGKAKAKAKSSPKAKAKSSPKGKAKAKAKTVKARRSRGKEGQGDQVEEDVEEVSGEKEPHDVETHDLETDDVKTSEEKREPQVESEKKPSPTKKKGETPGEEPSSKKPKKEPSKSFARRPCPATSPAKDKWMAISQTFKSQVQPQILEAGEKVSKWEERGRGVREMLARRSFIILYWFVFYNVWLCRWGWITYDRFPCKEPFLNMVTKAFKKAEDAGPVDVSELEKIAVDCIPSFLNLVA